MISINYLRSLSQSKSLVTVGLLMIVSAILASCSKPQPLNLTAAIANQPDNVLNYIAIEKGFFEAQGLNFNYDFYPSGKRAFTDGFALKDYDLVTMTAVPFVFALSEHPDLKLFGHIYSANNVNRLVARQDVGFDSIDQIQDKVIGTQQNSAVHYFFHRVYNTLDIPRTAFTLKFYSAEQLPQALASGEIDAFSMREPYVSQAKELLKGQVNIFSMPGVFNQFGILVSNQATIERKPEALKRYLKGLKQARAFALNSPEESIKILAKYLSISVAEARESWRISHLQLGLNQAVINTLEGEIYWRNYLTQLGLDNSKFDLKTFDISKYINIELMMSVNPESVMVIYEHQQSK